LEIKRGKNSGLALGTVLACLAALVLILFTVVTSSINHLRFVNAHNTREHAKNLAEAALSQSIADLATSKYLLNSGQVLVTTAGLDDAEGVVSFDTSGTLGQAFSVNNLQSDEQVTGAQGRAVPGRTAHLVARGRVGDVEQWVECLLYKPPFPDGLITTGPVEASSLQLTGIRVDDGYVGGDPSSTITPENLVPGNLFSNAAQGGAPGSPAVTLAAACDITGSVGAAGGITVDTGSTVGGEVLPGSSARPVPSIDITSRISAVLPNAVGVSSTGGDLTLDANWFNKAPNLNVGGDLILNGSVLVVQGDLTVNGSFQGTGVVLVDGDVMLTSGGSSVVADEQVAIACTGDMTLRASDPTTNYFKGLLYCEGDLEARHITVVGATVVNGQNGSAGAATIENVRFVYSPGGVRLSLRLPKGKKYKRTSGGVGNSGRHFALSFTRDPAPDGNGHLFHFRFYGTRKGDLEGNNVDHPLKWPGSGADTTRFFSMGPELLTVNETMTLAEIKAHPQVVDLASRMTARLFTELVLTPPETWVPDPPDNSQNLSDQIPNAIYQDFREEPDVYTESFELNNLFADFSGRSRILLWRAFER
jgi:hypothetical protein